MKISNKNLLLSLAVIVSVLWQPSHHFFMNHGMPMDMEIHALITLVPFLSIMFALGKAKLI